MNSSVNHLADSIFLANVKSDENLIGYW